MNYPPIKLIQSCVRYDPVTGKFFSPKDRPRDQFESMHSYRFWKSRWSNRELAGKWEIHFNIYGVTYKMRRNILAWALASGAWPNLYVDHINGNISDNRISNLRLATSQQNSCNMKRHVDNKSGLKGVFFSRHAKRFSAQICSDGKRKYLGYFNTKEAAHEAYVRAAENLHGSFARAN